MLGLITGICLFSFAAVVANILQARYRYSYTKNPGLFILLFLVCMSGSAWFSNYLPSLSLVVSLLTVASFYVVGIQCLALYWKPMLYLYGSNTLPIIFDGIIRPKFRGQLVKVSEVVLQDVAAWLIVGGLLGISQSMVYSMLVFTTIVFLLHIPGLWIFGRVYGGYFLLMSSALAFLVPLLYYLEEIGFTCLLALHLGGYFFMYIVMGLLGTPIKSHKKVL